VGLSALDIISKADQRLVSDLSKTILTLKALNQPAQRQAPEDSNLGPLAVKLIGSRHFNTTVASLASQIWGCPRWMNGPLIGGRTSLTSVNRSPIQTEDLACLLICSQTGPPNTRTLSGPVMGKL